ncbi:MAG TPA: nuclear transport factor 2 family protein [Anaerolineales bacterium]|nr:nuclear transport factor 2 family protein [Anaerolineales bacterium]HNB37478.1 nuclear transport factor 2 family protein [Anaerolineales bacterium]
MSDIEEQIRQIFEGYKTAVFEKNVEAFLALYDENIHLFDMWEKWSYNGKDAWREMVSNWFGSLGDEKVVVDFDSLTVTATNEIAVVHTFVTYKAVASNGNELRSMNNRLTAALKKSNGTWKIFHEHSSAPLDGNTLKATLQRQ